MRTIALGKLENATLYQKTKLLGRSVMDNFCAYLFLNRLCQA